MPDCIVIGGGISGVLTALELKKQGADVLLIERGAIGGEATWAGGGIISPLYPWRYDQAVNQLAAISQQMYPSLADSLQLETGVDTQYHQCGMILLDDDETELALDWGKQWQHQVEIVDAKTLQQLDPVKVNSAGRGVYLPDIAQIRNPRLVKALAAVLPRRQIEYLEHTAVSAIKFNQQKVNGVTAGDSFYPAEKVIVAGGAWTGQIFKHLKLQLNIKPVKGQMILFKGTPGLLKHMIMKQGRYLIPRLDGRILAGSTLEHTGYEKQLTLAAREELAQAAIDIVPALANLEIEHHWAGLRPGTENGIPYIGSHPGIEDLYYNAGQFRNGVVLGPSSAKLMADIVMGNETDLDPAAFSYNAFH